MTFLRERRVSTGAISLLVFFLLLAPFPLRGEDQEPIPVVPAERFPETFLNKDYLYDISFLWFTKAAEARFYFEKGEGPSEYRAVLDAETKGFIGWLSSDRRQRYVSVMDMVDTDKGRMLRTKYFSQEIRKGDRSEIVESFIDYTNYTITTRESNPGGKTAVSVETIPKDIIYHDFLSAYYNLRGGAFGVRKKGDLFKVDTLPRKGVSHIDVTIADEETERDRKIDMEDAHFLVRLDVDKRLFGQSDGEVWVWADRDFVPVMGEVKHISLFGDVRGYRKSGQEVRQPQK